MTRKPTAPADTVNGKFQRVANLQWIPLGAVTLNPLAQRDLNPARVDRLVADFDPEQLGAPTCNHRGDTYHVIDGHHRMEALKVWLGEGWEDQQVQTWTYEGLTDEEEAEIFLKLNDVLAVNAFTRFRIGVQAGRPVENDIERIVHSLGLRVAQDKNEGSISAVGTMVRVYTRSDPQTLGHTLLLIRDAYGDSGLEAPVIDGIGLLCHRYGTDLDNIAVIDRLSKARGGVQNLLGKAENIRRLTGNPRNHCVAAAAVEIINGTRGGKKLPSWWHSEDQS